MIMTENPYDGVLESMGFEMGVKVDLYPQTATIVGWCFRGGNKAKKVEI